MQLRQMIIALREPERFTEDEKRASRLLASDIVLNVSNSLRERAQACEGAVGVLRGPWGSSTEEFAKARGLAADLLAEDLWREVEHDIRWLRNFRHYLMQPPVFQSHVTVYDMVASEGGCVFSADHDLHFGFPKFSLGEALIRVLRIRHKSQVDILVGSKASEEYDEMYFRTQDHLGHGCIPDFILGPVAFCNLDAYATVYCRNPRTLLQPVLRQRRGLREYPLPTREEHQRLALQIWEYLGKSAPSQMVP